MWDLPLDDGRRVRRQCRDAARRPAGRPTPTVARLGVARGARALTASWPSREASLVGASSESVGTAAAPPGRRPAAAVAVGATWPSSVAGGSSTSAVGVGVGSPRRRSASADVARPRGRTAVGGPAGGRRLGRSTAGDRSVPAVRSVGDWSRPRRCVDSRSSARSARSGVGHRPRRAPSCAAALGGGLGRRRRGRGRGVGGVARRRLGLLGDDRGRLVVGASAPRPLLPVAVGSRPARRGLALGVGRGSRRRSRSASARGRGERLVGGWPTLAAGSAEASSRRPGSASRSPRPRPTRPASRSATASRSDVATSPQEVVDLGDVVARVGHAELAALDVLGCQRHRRLRRPRRDALAPTTTATCSLTGTTTSVDRGRPWADPARGLRFAAMQEILDAIQAGASGDDLANLPIPESYRAAFVLRDEAGDVRGARLRGQGPAQVAARRRGRHARAGARRGLRGGDGQRHQLQHGVDLDLRAAADLRLPRPARQGERGGAPATPCRTTSSAPTRRASCSRSARRCATGSRATGSRSTATTSTTRTRRAHDDSMLAANQRIWGFETNFGGLADLDGGQGQPAHAQARPPHLGGGGVQRACATRRATACSCQPQRRRR